MAYIAKWCLLMKAGGSEAVWCLLPTAAVPCQILLFSSKEGELFKIRVPLSHLSQPSKHFSLYVGAILIAQEHITGISSLSLTETISSIPTNN